MTTIFRMPIIGVIALFAACVQPRSEGTVITSTNGEESISPGTEEAGSKELGNFDFAMSKVCQASCGVSNYSEDDLVPIADAKVGDITMCPVSGAIYKVKESSPKIEHDGLTYHACCSGCANKFKKDPERFSKNV